jgi:uncharacterized secreted protein with C-terminal beta-propeller domain
MDAPLHPLLAGIDLSNPATPWVVLALVIAGWLAAYLYGSVEPRS